MVLWLIFQVQALHFYLYENTEKCFYFDIPKNTVTVGDYSMSESPPMAKPETGVKLTVYSPLKYTLLERWVRASGKFSFTA